MISKAVSSLNDSVNAGFGLDELWTIVRGRLCVDELILQGSGKGLTWLFTMVHVPLGMGLGPKCTADVVFGFPLLLY